MLTSAAILALLPDTLQTLPVTVAKTLTSTNLVAKKQLQAGAASPFCLIAEQQTAGIGRRGKAFFSPANTGLYLTYAFTPPDTAPLPLITPAAGVALQATVAATTGVATTIKWVNDLLLGDQKVAGILAEILPGPQVIVGFGLNIAPAAVAPTIPIDLPLGTVLQEAPPQDLRPVVAAGWLARFTAFLAKPETIMPAYRQHAAWVGAAVTVTGLAQPQSGTLVGFADDGALLLQTPDGLQTFTAGSIRRQ